MNVRADGTIGITYYDLRHDTQTGTILSDCWMVTSSDGRNFSEIHLSGPFNLDLAPQGEFGPNNTPGLFLGDYQSLASTSAAAQGLPRAAPAFRAATAPRGVTLSEAVRARITQRIRLLQAQRVHIGH